MYQKGLGSQNYFSQKSGEHNHKPRPPQTALSQIEHRAGVALLQLRRSDNAFNCEMFRVCSIKTEVGFETTTITVNSRALFFEF